jgi:hypothetical protein
MEPRKTETITIRVTKQTKALLRGEARKDSRKIGSLCTILVEEAIKERIRKQAQEGQAA